MAIYVYNIRKIINIELCMLSNNLPRGYMHNSWMQHSVIYSSNMQIMLEEGYGLESTADIMHKL